MSKRSDRRRFLQGTALAAGGYWLGGSAPSALSESPNEKLNLGIVGVSGRGASNLGGVTSQNIVALCDIDDNYLAQRKEQFPKAELYNDCRRLVDRNDLDAVVVSTPDHTHAPATLLALRAGKHVYCEKPLTHTVAEARLVAQTAKEHDRVTQMGTQIHAGSNYRRVVELIQTGAIGPVSEVHVWVGKDWSDGRRPAKGEPVPQNIHWDLWLGPAAERPYHSVYLPRNWRRFWAFGNGTLGDMACHYMDLPFWALGLRYPTAVQAAGPAVDTESAGKDLVVTYEFPQRDRMPPVTLTWYDGQPRPRYFDEGKLPQWGSSGVLFVGAKGMLIAGYNSHKLLPEDRFEGFQPPEPFLPDSIGHHNEWIEACKTGSAKKGGTTTCNFEYSGALTEAVLLGVVAYKTGAKLYWDAENLRAANCPAAEAFIRKEYRKGWSV